MFTTAAGDRAGVPNIIVLLTDGPSIDFNLMATAANNTRNAGIEIYSIGEYNYYIVYII